MPAPTSGADVLAVALDLAALDDTSGPVAGPGSLSINEEAVHGYDYTVIDGPLTVSAFDASDFFTATEDSRSAWVVVKGDLAIDAGQVFTPAQRKLFTVLYVDGDLTVNGDISMTARGANHSASGSDLAAADIRIYQGTIDGVENPQVPAAGADGGASNTITSGSQNAAGNPGASGANGQSGGGGGGGMRRTNGSATSGAGSAGTAFSSGTGGGGIHSSCAGTFAAEDGEPNGGKGGDGEARFSTANNVRGGGGAGNAGGLGVINDSCSSTTPNGEDGQDGTGGTLIIIVTGQLLGSGGIHSAGSNGGNSSNGGGASGGGSVTVLCATDGSTVTVAAPGGTGGTGLTDDREGGDGGNGTARVLEGLEIPIQPPANLQATAVGTDQINVTWDAVAGADGYEIEIDSGSPIDVGNVLLHEDTGLDPGTTRSYRVRAYAGSPQEFSDWAGPVEATTEADATVVIPARAVIVVDMVLSGEAPVLGAPPGAGNANISTNLLEHWDYEEGSGSTITGNHNSTVMTAVTPANFGFSGDAKLGNFCGIMGSTGTRLNAPSAAFANFAAQSFSIAVWMNAAAIRDSFSPYITSRKNSGTFGGDQYRLIISNPDDQLQFRVAVVSPSSQNVNVEIPAIDWSLNQWHLVQISWDRDEGVAAIYMDGELRDSAAATGEGPFSLLDTGTQLYQIWGIVDSSANSFEGRMDDTLIYTSPATLADHVFLWNNGNGRTYEEIIA